MLIGSKRGTCLVFNSRVAEFLLVYPLDPSSHGIPALDEWSGTGFGAPPLRPPGATPSSSFASTTTDVTMSTGEAGPSTQSHRKESKTPASSSSPSTQPDLVSLGLRDEEPMDEETADLFMIARSLYDAKEHERVAYLLRYVKHPKARFLGLYSRYIVRGLPALFLSDIAHSTNFLRFSVTKV